MAKKAKSVKAGKETGDSLVLKSVSLKKSQWDFLRDECDEIDLGFSVSFMIRRMVSYFQDLDSDERRDIYLKM